MKIFAHIFILLFLSHIGLANAVLDSNAFNKFPILQTKPASLNTSNTSSKFLEKPAPFSTDNASEIRIDCSSEAKMNESIANMIISLDDTRQQAFAAALATIGVALSQKPELGGPNGLKNLIDNKNADEVIAISRRLAKHIKSNRLIIDGASLESFGKSIGELLVNLPIEKQTAFSEAIARLMYDSEKNGEAKEKLAKRLDGKNVEEIIAMANHVDAPSSTNTQNIKDYQLSTISKEEAKKQFNIKETPPPQPQPAPPSYNESLSPNSIF